MGWVAVSASIFEADHGFLDYLLPPAILEVEHHGNRLVCVSMSEHVMNCDLGPADVNFWAGEVKIVQGVHLAPALGADVCFLAVAFDLDSDRHEEPEIQIVLGCSTGEARRGRVLNVCKGIDER
jgi:hypothetical protein